MGSRERLNTLSDVSLPGNPLLEDSVRWSKQMLAASVQEVEDARLRETNAGRNYPRRSPPWTTCAGSVRGGPTTRGCSAPMESTPRLPRSPPGSSGRSRTICALRDVSVAINGDSGKIVHEVTPDGAVYFGANADPGNTDESSKYPSAVALVWRWTGDKAFLKDLIRRARRDGVRGRAGRGQ